MDAGFRVDHVPVWHRVLTILIPDKLQTGKKLFNKIGLLSSIPVKPKDKG